MSNASGQQYGVGLKHVSVYALNANNRPAGTGATPYYGVEVVGKRTISINVPEPRRVDHYDGDSIDAVDYLPPNESVTGELLIHGDDFTFDEAVSQLNSFNVGEMTLLLGGTERIGEEPEVGMMVYQQSLDKTAKTRRWRFVIFPRTKLVSLPGGMDENPSEVRYTFIASPVSTQLWGAAIAVGVEGAEKASYVRGMSTYKPSLAAFLGDNTTTVFPFATDKQAASTDKMAIYVNGTLTTSGITKATTGVTFTVAPATNADIDVVYELAV